MKGWEPVGDHTKGWGRGEGIILRQDGREQFLFKFDRLEHNIIILWVVVEAMTLDHNVGTSGVGGNEDSLRCLRGKPLSFGLLESLLSVSDTFNEELIGILGQDISCLQHHDQTEHEAGEPEGERRASLPYAGTPEGRALSRGVRLYAAVISLDFF